jgi:predicted RNA binding protein YcfA (HicA-like mRNA interferase family)
MPKLPTVTGEEAIAAFARYGFVLKRISKSSHHVLKKDGHRFLLSVPVHSGQNLKTGTLRSLISDAGLSVEGFIELLRS